MSISQPLHPAEANNSLARLRNLWAELAQFSGFPLSKVCPDCQKLIKVPARRFSLDQRSLRLANRIACNPAGEANAEDDRRHPELAGPAQKVVADLLMQQTQRIGHSAGRNHDQGAKAHDG